MTIHEQTQIREHLESLLEVLIEGDTESAIKWLTIAVNNLGGEPAAECTHGS
mgnify:CR=1 FL=1